MTSNHPVAVIDKRKINLMPQKLRERDREITIIVIILIVKKRSHILNQGLSGYDNNKGALK